MSKVFYIANIRLPTEKAHGIQIMKMCEAFAREGHEVELIVPRRKTHIEADSFEYYSVENNFKITRLPTLDLVRFGWLGFWIQSLTFAESASWYTLQKRGIFYTRDELPALFLRLMGKKIIWEVHMGQMNIFARFLLLLKVPLVAITAKMKDLYVNRGVDSELILVEHDAVDLKDFENLLPKHKLREELGLPENKLIISYIGKFKTLGHTKGVEDIAEAFAGVYLRNKNIFLLIVGSEKEENEELTLLLHKAEVPESGYKIVEHVLKRIAPKYMKASDVLLMMYPNTLHYSLYMSPLKLFEYMASGSPILAPRLPSLEEIINDKNSYLFKPENKEDFKDKLLSIVNNFNEAAQKAVQATLDVQDHTWEKRAKRILNFIT